MFEGVDSFPVFAKERLVENFAALLVEARKLVASLLSKLENRPLFRVFQKLLLFLDRRFGLLLESDHLFRLRLFRKGLEVDYLLLTLRRVPTRVVLRHHLVPHASLPGSIVVPSLPLPTRQRLYSASLHFRRNSVRRVFLRLENKVWQVLRVVHRAHVSVSLFFLVQFFKRTPFVLDLQTLSKKVFHLFLIAFCLSLFRRIRRLYQLFLKIRSTD